MRIDEENGLLRIRASGELESSDYDDFVPRFEQLVGRKPGKLPMVIELAPDFAGWDLPGLWRDLKFDARHRDSFGRIAIVGDAKWEEWGTRLSDPLFHAQMKFFEPSERRVAEIWARSGESIA
ncbi:STAS/SEC14 domain-containing protein [Altererythrobacter endophyticus]|uniref:STAS/SEC14 domain-containing protein n=1 Tax=Altericroceibacterium endophyticum TaxID=1808508 RepID=A0A6I4T3D4_9SPHN|nr:STAS/SEC14 domain-containing protein [Altericroceibacterium endophyticum]